MRRQVSQEKIYNLTQKHKMQYIEVSSKSGKNVKESLYKLAFASNETLKKKGKIIPSKPIGPYANEEGTVGGQANRVQAR